MNNLKRIWETLNNFKQAGVLEAELECGEFDNIEDVESLADALEEEWALHCENTQ